MKIETDYLAEEWLDFLKEEVEPNFPGITFSAYTPHHGNTIMINGNQLSVGNTIRYNPKVAVEIDDKSLFLFELKGQQTNKRTTEVSLQRYVYEITGKVMLLR